MAAGVTQADANRTPVLDVAYGDRFKLNAVDIRTVAITQPKVFGTNTDIDAGIEALATVGQTLDAGVRVKCTTSDGIFVFLDGATLEGNGFFLDDGDEVFIECSQLSTVKVKGNAANQQATFIAT